MILTKFIKENPTFTDAEIITEWCRPLALMNITYFCHVHIDKQNRFSLLSNYPEFAHHYLEQHFHLYDVHMNSGFKRNQMIIWVLLTPSGGPVKMHQDFLAFGKDHTFTIIQPNESGCDYFHFAANVGRFEINHVYLSKRDLFEQFISYYRDKLSSSKQLQKRLSQKIKLRKPDQPIALAQFNSEFDEQAFYQMTAHKRQYLKSGDVYLTPAEINCLYWLAHGKSFEETALILQISLRTVKAHIQHSKEKLQCNNLFQLGMYFKEKYAQMCQTAE